MEHAKPGGTAGVLIPVPAKPLGQDFFMGRRYVYDPIDQTMAAPGRKMIQNLDPDNRLI